MQRTYQGACHCGRVTFELQAKLDYAIDCNCSLYWEEAAKAFYARSKR